MYGVIDESTNRLLSRHLVRGIAKQVSKKRPSYVVTLRSIPGYRGMIGHTWPAIGSLWRGERPKSAEQGFKRG